MTLIDQSIADHYKLIEQIGKGSFGEIYKAIDTNTNEEVAIKLESNFAKTPQIQLEARVYKTLASGFGVPNIYCYGFNRTHNFLVIDLLGQSLENLFQMCDQKFSLKTVLMLADQMISCIEFVHSKNLIYRDVKPDNFMMGVNHNSNLVYLIDYGLTKNYRDPRTHVHIPYSDKCKLTGTARYASVNTLSGVEQSRRDDLECLGYVWAYFLRGSLPWMGLDTDEENKNAKNKYKLICDVKKKTSFEELFSGFPQEFAQYMFSVRQLRFGDHPNYSSLRAILRKAFLDNGFIYDYVYDWTDKKPSFNVEKVPKITMEKPLSRLENQQYNKYPITEDDLFPIPQAPLYVEPQRRPRSKTFSHKTRKSPNPKENRVPSSISAVSKKKALTPMKSNFT